MEKENQRVALTKHLLKQGLLRLLQEKTMDKISVTELCRVSGINRATFYRHFQTPADVLEAIELDLVKEIRMQLAIPKTRKDIQSNFEKVCTYLYENAERVRFMIRNHSDADLMHLVNNFSEEVLRDRQFRSQFDDLDADGIILMTTFLGGGVYLLLRRWLMEDIRKTPQEITQLLLRFVDFGSRIPD